MKKATLTKLCIAVATAVSLTTTFAGPERMDTSKEVIAPPPVCDPRWYISIGGGTDFPVSEFSNGLTETVGGTDLAIKSRDWHDQYNNFLTVKGEVGYVLTDHIELFGNFQYEHGDSELQRGSMATFAGRTREYFSKWGDYDAFGGELGARWYFFPKDAKIRPYISIAGGATMVESIKLHADQSSPFFSTGGPFTIYDGGFYDDTIVFTGTVMVGVEYNVTCHWSVGSGVGVRYQSELDENDHDFNAASLSAVRALTALNHNNGDRISIPATVYAKFRF
jgi:opacity protein-like surface antigen